MLKKMMEYLFLGNPVPEEMKKGMEGDVPEELIIHGDGCYFLDTKKYTENIIFDTGVVFSDSHCEGGGIEYREIICLYKKKLYCFDFSECSMRWRFSSLSNGELIDILSKRGFSIKEMKGFLKKHGIKGDKNEH